MSGIVIGLDHANFSVSNIEESFDFYQRLFGYVPVEKGIQDGVRWGILRCNDALLCMYEKPELEFLDRFTAAKMGYHYVSHVGVKIEDKQAWLDIVEKENVTLNYGGAIETPHATAWYVTDPTGWEIEVALWHDGICFDALQDTLDAW